MAPRSSRSRSTSPAEVLLVYKKSKLSLYVQEKRNLRVSALVDEGAPIVSQLKLAHEVHGETLAHVKSVMSRAGVSFKTCYRARLKAEDTAGRLVVTVGGDGTVLDASHRIEAAKVLGVNSDPERSVGFLCAATLETFAELLDKVRSGDLAPTQVPRLGGELDGKPLPFPVLNELLVAHKNPAATVRYDVDARGVRESHKSSGVWLAAPAGSTAAIASSGGVVQAIDDAHYQLRVREPYRVDGTPPEHHALLLDAEEEVTLTSRMPQGAIYLDGPHVRLAFPVGAQLRLHARARPLSLVVTDDMRARRDRLRDRLAGWNAARPPKPPSASTD